MVSCGGGREEGSANAAKLKFRPSALLTRLLNNKMAQQRLSLWNAEEDIEGDVDLSIAMGNYDPTVQYEECK